jgi:hypothetical protein
LRKLSGKGEHEKARGGLCCCPVGRGSWQNELQFETVVYRVADFILPINCPTQPRAPPTGQIGLSVSDFRDRESRLNQNSASLQYFYGTQDALIPQSGLGSCISLMHRMRKFHFKLPPILVPNFLGLHSFLSGVFPSGGSILPRLRPLRPAARFLSTRLLASRCTHDRQKRNPGGSR